MREYLKFFSNATKDQQNRRSRDEDITQEFFQLRKEKSREVGYWTFSTYYENTKMAKNQQRLQITSLTKSNIKIHKLTWKSKESWSIKW
jgi:Zn-dependent oligopeptidase